MQLQAVDFSVLVLKEILSDKAKGVFNEAIIDEFLDGVAETDMDMIGEEIESIDVVTATPLEEKFKTKLSDTLKKKLDRVITINLSVDEKIISGMVIKFGSLSLDGGLKHLLEDKGVDVKEKLEKGLLEKE